MEKLYSKIVLPKLEIPKIDDKKLVELYHLLRPIVTIEEMKYLLREFTLLELRNQSYIWDQNKDKREIVESSKLETIGDFLCLHTYGYYGLFKPSIEEVLAQFPSEMIKEANTFEIIEKPETMEDIYKYPEVLDKGFHLSKVRAYKMHK